MAEKQLIAFHVQQSRLSLFRPAQRRFCPVCLGDIMCNLRHRVLVLNLGIYFSLFLLLTPTFRQVR